MQVTTKEDRDIFLQIKQLFNHNANRFLMLVICFSPLILLSHLTGVLLDPYYMNAEKYGRMASFMLLVVFSYLWLTSLFHKDTPLLKAINGRLVKFMVLVALCIFIPFQAVKILQWLMAMKGNIYGKELEYTASALSIVATYLIMTQTFTLMSFIEGRICSPIASLRLSLKFMVPALKGLVLFLLPLSIFIFLYMYIINYFIMKFEVTEQGPLEAITYTILYAPIFLLIHPFMIAFSLTGFYWAYTHSKAALISENSP